VGDQDGFAMRWSLTGPGSARLTWTVNDDACVLGSSYVGDGLSSVLQAALDLKLGSSATIAYLSGEPGSHLIFFAGADNGTVYVQVVLFPVLESGENKWAGAMPRWAGRLSIAGYITATRVMAEAVLDEYGDDGYVKASGGLRFPSDILSALQ
jgi:hypothetical protein